MLTGISVASTNVSATVGRRQKDENTLSLLSFDFGCYACTDSPGAANSREEPGGCSPRNFAKSRTATLADATASLTRWGTPK